MISDDRTPEAIARALNQVISNPDHYTQSACVRVAEPYSARKVVGQVYESMLHRWHTQQHGQQQTPIAA